MRRMAVRVNRRRSKQTRSGEFSMIWCPKLDYFCNFFTLFLKNSSAGVGDDVGELETLVGSRPRLNFDLFRLAPVKWVKFLLNCYCFVSNDLFLPLPT